ncbi:trans-aconitate 2-methyltransferase [Ancylobacter sp. 6x-1]|uniref:Trans-aconitate 2-methyltransferase n=1 Tax=Ancylobacter crimeensis TaxID=2579147 RepID=A0ABT0DA67_9HYPH|nr:trans-aconitate 2-methyltransferase [Ancylobacter crimeensis]MCK0196789.1 trans-aconitate 2-methyltransferase [Ancylobacter crimeensis]
MNAKTGTEDWNPGLYLTFADERTRPSRDLLAQVPLTAPRRIVDIGCGPGNSTGLLVQRWPQAQTQGIDSSPAMIEEAARTLPGVRFEVADVATWQPEPDTDLLFANAVFQWLPEHPAILQRLLQALPEGGVLAVQMPDNLTEPTHRLMRETAADGPWAQKLRSAARAPLPPVSSYYDLLAPYARHVDIWHTFYNHPLDGPEAVVEWVKATGLRPFLAPLDAGERTAFLSAYTARIADAYPRRVDGKVLLRFPRLFMVAVR